MRPDRDDPGHRDLRQDVLQVAERREGIAGGPEEDDQCEQRCERCDIAELPMQPVGNTAFAEQKEPRVASWVSLMRLPATGPC